jgi:hypothetical protein
MKGMGFINVEYVGSTPVATSQFTVGGTFRARKGYCRVLVSNKAAGII